LTPHNPALVGKAGELLVAAEVMTKGIEVAYPASDVGIDLLAYRLSPGETMAARFVPIQVKARSKSGYNFQRSWFTRVPGVVLVQVWHVITTPVFYVFDSLPRVEEALGMHAVTSSWLDKGGYSVTAAGPEDIEKMKPHQNRWERITDQLRSPSSSHAAS
jgi:hypothetical protein